MSTDLPLYDCGTCSARFHTIDLYQQHWMTYHATPDWMGKLPPPRPRMLSDAVIAEFAVDRLKALRQAKETAEYEVRVQEQRAAEAALSEWRRRHVG